MTNRKPDGWAWSSPEGEWCGNDEEIHIDRVEPDMELVNKNPINEGYIVRPVILVPLDYYNKMEAWVEKVRGYLKKWGLNGATPGPALLAELEELRKEEHD